MPVAELLVVGDPVAHSRSPAVQNAMIEALGLPFRYGWRTVTPDALDGFLAYARAGGCAGFNATMPLKELLVTRVDELRGDAGVFGAINTVCVRNGRLIGHNTDGQGFLHALRTAGFDPAGRAVSVFGAGGAAKAVALTLANAGAASVTVCNRTVEKARALCAFAPDRMTPREDFSCAGADLLVNCTNLGMTGSAQFPDFDFLDGLPPHAMVCDLIYNPTETELLRTARTRGHGVQNGLPMLARQAVLALALFSDTEIDAGAMLPVIEGALQTPPHG